MAPTHSHPGVYLQEVPGTRSIQRASTSVAAVVGVTEFGPIATPTFITSWNAYVRQFGNLVWYGYASWAVFEFFNEGGSACWVVRADDAASAAPATVSSGSLTAMAATAGTWGNHLGVAFTDSRAQASGSDPPPVFDFLVVVDAESIDATPSGPPSSPDLSIAILQNHVRQNGLPTRTIAGKACYVLEVFEGFTEADMQPGGAFMQRVNGGSMFVRVNSSAAARPADAVASLAGGTTPRHDLVGAVRRLGQVQGVSLLAVPDTVTATNAAAGSSPRQQASLINQSLAVCEELQNLFYVSDPPFGLSVQDMLAFKNGTGTGANANNTPLNSSHGAIYYPWVSVRNAAADVQVAIPPSGPVLGRYAFTDANVGVWKSPAGVNDGAMSTVETIATQLTDGDQDALNPEGINALRHFLHYGNVIWGARTLSPDDSWTYVGVRRLFICVEQSLKQSLQWVVFEPNDQALWSAVGRDVSAFLTSLWQQGAVFGATAHEAFFVTCDASNNPPQTRMLGQLFIDIGLAAVYPAEFTVIRIVQKTAGPDAGS